MHPPVKNAVAALAAARRNHQAAPSVQAFQAGSSLLLPEITGANASRARASR